jgi:predicted AlkP superfamily phosphohydrolase/phosphomutase
MSAGPSPAPRVLVIGLDGATWSYLAPLAERGVLPNLKQLMTSGAWGDLLSTIPPLTPPAWASLVTGTNPGKHSIYHFRQFTAGDYYQQRLNTSRDVHAPTIWQRLNRHGKRVGVINVPNSHPIYPVDGFITTDAFTPAEIGFAVHPSELAAEFADYIVDVKNYPEALPGRAQYLPQLRAFIEENRQVLRAHAATALKLMRTQPWQFFMVAWMVTDRLGHFCWQYIQPDATGELAELCRSVLAEADQQLARLIAAAGDDCTVVIASDHGFGPHPTRFFHLAKWLHQTGYLQLLPSWHWQRLVHGSLPRSLKGKFGGPIDSKYGLVDWSRTKVWADPLGARTSGIRINRRGQYPNGIVDAAEADRLLAELPGKLRALRAPTGEPVVAQVYRGQDLYHGPAAAAGPDLVVVFEQDFDVPPSFRRDVRAPHWIMPNRHVLRDGEHLPTGMFLLHGRNIRPAGQLDAQSICAIAPTILQAFGLPVDDDMDAEPITGAFTEEFLRACPPRRASAAAVPMPEQPEYSAKDSEEIEKRLRNLGYLD